MLAVNPDLKVNSVKDLVALIKANPGKYNFASIGNGSLSHLAMEAIAIKAGTKLVHVPYPSSPQAITAVIRDDAQMACLPAISVTPQAKAGKVKMLAVSTAKRSPYLPDLPTLKESGIDVEADAWMGLIAPGGTPKAMVDKINKDVVAIIKAPAVREKLATQLMEPVGSTPEEFRARIERRDRPLGAGDQGGECEGELRVSPFPPPARGRVRGGGRYCGRRKDDPHPTAFGGRPPPFRGR